MMYRIYRLRLKPTAGQRRAMEGILALSCDLYNAALQERRDAWKAQHKNVSYQNQQKQLTEIRQEDSGIRSVAVDIAREPLRRIDRAFKAFFRRCKNGEKPGYPRFKSKARYDSFGFGGNRPRLVGNVLMVPSVGGIRFRATQTIVGTPKVATVKRQGKRWTARVVCDIGPAPEKRPVSTATGIDVGVSVFATLSDGTSIDNPRWTKRFEQKLARANQMLARKKRGSKNRIRARLVLSRTHERIQDARRNFTHHVSKYLVSNYDLIAFEKLNIQGLVRNQRLAKSVLDAAWGELIWQITYKAESAGKWAVPVNPKGTSQRCSNCGVVVKKTLSERQHNCACGLSLDRDHNAAINILALGVSAAGLCPSERVRNT